VQRRRSKPREYRIILSNDTSMRVIAVSPQKALARGKKWCERQDGKVSIVNLVEVI
jgi:hypothetical protein